MYNLLKKDLVEVWWTLSDFFTGLSSVFAGGSEGPFTMLFVILSDLDDLSFIAVRPLLLGLEGASLSFALLGDSEEMSLGMELLSSLRSSSSSSSSWKSSGFRSTGAG